MTLDVRQPHVSMARPAAVVLDSAAGRSTQSTRATQSLVGINLLVATIISWSHGLWKLAVLITSAASRLIELPLKAKM